MIREGLNLFLDAYTMQTHDIIEALEGMFKFRATVFATRVLLYDAQTRQ